MAAVGTRFSYYNDPSAVGSTAYVNEAEIPLHVMDLLNLYMKDIDHTVVITERDICQFMNDALRRYYTQDGWNTSCQIDEKMDYDDEMDQTVGHGVVAPPGQGSLNTSATAFGSACAMVGGDECDDKEALHRSLRANQTGQTTLADVLKQETLTEKNTTYGILKQPKVECEDISEEFGETTGPTLTGRDIKPENDKLFVKRDIDAPEAMTIDLDNEPRHPGCSVESSSVPAPELDA
ncbi:hypothetical protein OSTOST_06628, partial [Ostertagia ostertagi]